MSADMIGIERSRGRVTAARASKRRPKTRLHLEHIGALALNLLLWIGAILLARICLR